MKKKTIIIVIIFFTVFIIGILMLIISNLNNNKPIARNDEYSVDEASKDFARLVVPAVENFANQDRLESKKDRINRLSKYFLKDSPVYEYEQININDSVKKCESTALSVESWPMEGSDVMFIVNVKLKYHFNDHTYEDDKSYWITATKEEDGTYKPYDIGEYNQ